jgi:hypothetical protein
MDYARIAGSMALLKTIKSCLASALRPYNEGG